VEVKALLRLLNTLQQGASKYQGTYFWVSWIKGAAMISISILMSLLNADAWAATI